MDIIAVVITQFINFRNTTNMELKVWWDHCQEIVWGDMDDRRFADYGNFNLNLWLS
jgi:hypothetical protein